jgi:hypothetical protein
LILRFAFWYKTDIHPLTIFLALPIPGYQKKRYAEAEERVSAIKKFKKLKIMENQFRVIVAGGRDFFDYHLLESKLNKLLSQKENVVIVSGNAKGADQLGERYARQHKLLISSFPALWNLHGTKAGFIRNEEMAKNADAVVCFWDSVSTGTKHMIDTAVTMNIPLRVINY